MTPTAEHAADQAAAHDPGHTAGQAGAGSSAGPAEAPPSRYDWRVLADMVLRHRRELILANLVAILAALAAIPMPLILSLMVDEVLLDDPGAMVAFIDQLSPPSWQGPLWYLLAALLATLVLRFANVGLSIVETRLFGRIAQDVVFRMRGDLLHRLERVSMAEYETLAGGTVASHLVTDMNAIDDMVSSAVSRFLVATLTILGTAAVLLWMHWQLGLFILLLNPVVIYITTRFGRRVKALKRQENHAFQGFQESIAETLDAIRQIRASNREGFYVGRSIASARRIRDTSFEYRWKADAANRLSFLIFIVGFDVFRVAAMLMVVFSDLSIGQMLAVFAYLWFMMNPLQTMLDVQYDYHSAQAALERINRLLGMGLEPKYPHLTDPFADKQTVGIDLRDVRFDYGGGEPVLNGVTLSIAAGEKVAVVGASGAGKTTLVQVILGLYPIRHGRILFDGVPVEDIGLDVVRDHVATVLQDPSLFNDSLRMNLTLGREIPDTRLWHALEIAQLKDVVEGLSGGLDAVLGRDGVRLSGGQRQRLAVARMVLADPKVVILDEATSALDTGTEERLHRAMTGFLSGRTTIIIAHRLTAVLQADRVVVMEQGRIIQEGRHEDLIDEVGHYAALYAGQR
jgi:ATP-binding cassette subfamily C protein